MASALALQTIRYPRGDTEFRLSDRAPEVGDILRRNGDNWVVEEVEEADDGSTVVTLRPRPLIEPTVTETPTTQDASRISTGV